jgi:hypothetical protein
MQEKFNWSTLTSTGMLFLVVVGAFWALAFGPIQDKFANFEHRLDALVAADLRVQTELTTRRSEFPTQFEFKQFDSRMEERFKALENRMNQLEVTRPTTGELQITTKAIEERLKMLEHK